MMLSVWLFQCSVLVVMMMSRYVYHPLLYSCEEGELRRRRVFIALAVL